MDFQNVFYNTKDFTITDKKLGKGIFGTVYVAERNKDHLQCAAKVINILTDIDGKDQMMIMRESVNLSKLKHPSIVKYYGVNFRSLKDRTKFSPTIITEYVANKSLKEILDKEKASNSPTNWSPTKKYICLLGISHAMNYLHDHEILHRDLKPENILMDEQFYPKVCDFGLSRCLSKVLSSSMKKSLTGKIGTPLYMAPELLDEDEKNAHEYGKGVDVYAFAMLAYEIVTGKMPFFEDSKEIKIYDLYDMVMNGDRPKFTNDVPEKMQLLIQKCWSQNAEDRPSFKEIFNTLSSDFSLSPEGVDEDEINNYLEMIIDNSNDKNHLKQENNQFQDQINKLKEENIHLQNQINQLKKDINNKQKQIKNLEIDNASKQENIDNKQKEIKKLEKDNEAKQNNINSKQQRIEKLEKDNEAKQNDINYKQQKIEKLEKDNEAKQNDINYKQQKIEKLEKYNEAKQNDINYRQQKIEKLEKDNESKQNDIDYKQQKIEKLEKYNEAKQNDINSKQQRIEELEKENETKQDDINSKQNRIKELKKTNERLKNIYNSNEEFSRAMNSIFGTSKERKMKSAISYLKISSDKGNCYASYLLAILYECGEGVEKDSSQMFNYYQKSSEQGNSHGYNRIGYCYDIGHVLPNNYSKAFEYYHKAEELGNSYAINNIGVLYWNGRFVEKNKTKAVEYYQKSADLGNSYALRNLAKLYLKGSFLKKNIEKAIECFQLSAEKVDSTSYIHLGDLYANGNGVEINLQKAKEYYQKAKDLDDPEAEEKSNLIDLFI